MQPRAQRVRRRSNQPSPILLTIRITRIRTTRIQFVLGVFETSFDASVRGEVELRSVGVVGVEVRGAFYDAFLAGGEGAEEFADVGFYVCVVCLVGLVRGWLKSRE